MGPLGEDLWEDEEEEMQKADRGCLGKAAERECLPTHKGKRHHNSRFFSHFRLWGE